MPTPPGAGPGLSWTLQSAVFKGRDALDFALDIAAGDANDPAFLEQLLAASVPIALAEGDRKVQDLRIAGIDRPF